MQVRSQFTCQSKTSQLRRCIMPSGQMVIREAVSVRLVAVEGTGVRDQSMALEDPNAAITVEVINPDAAAAFILGQQYYVDFSPVSGPTSLPTSDGRIVAT